jgi:hypothetical protein
MSINLSHVSPSCLGDYAACPQRLVYDTTYGKTFTQNPYADFGTICHYFTMYLLGVAPDKEPGDNIFESASQLSEIGGNRDKLNKAVMKCAQKAVDVLPKLGTGLCWVSEHKTYDKNILPTRVGRKGDVCGFGGDIDLMASDRSELWDLKFVSKPVDKVKTTYAWQLGAYHVTSRVPVTGILFVTRDARWAGMLKMDWRQPHFAELAVSIRNFLQFVDHNNFEKYAYPIEGEHCAFCEHKQRCPTKRIPMITGKLDMNLPMGDVNWLKSLGTASMDAVL